MFFSLCDLHIDSLAERNVAQTKKRKSYPRLLFRIIQFKTIKIILPQL